jgi:hypothetical protein
MTAAERGCRRRNERPDQHRNADIDRQIGAGLAGRVSGLAGLRVRSFRRSDYFIDPLLGVGLRETGARHYKLREIRLAIARNIAASDSLCEDACRLASHILIARIRTRMI